MRSLKEVQIKKKRVAFFLVVVLVWALAYVAMSPWRTVDDIKFALKHQDVDTLTELIDFNSIRKSVKDQLIKLTIKQNVLAATNQDYMRGVMVAAEAHALEITPQALCKGADVDAFETSVSYDGFSRAIVHAKQTETGAYVTFFMKRVGLAKWKVYDVDLTSLI